MGGENSPSFMNWFYATNEKEQVGPMDEATLDGLFKAGTINNQTLVWREGMEGWKTYGEERGFATPLVPMTVPEDQAICAETGKMFPKSEMVQIGDMWVSAAAKPAFLQRLSEGIEVTSKMRYAGFWIRFVAKLIDGLILVVVLVVPFIAIMASMGWLSEEGPPSEAAMIFQVVFQLGYYLVAAGYSIFFVGKYAATPGKMACKLKIVNPDGGKISYGRATGRFFAEILSSLICNIGYIMAAFDSEKRALHDRICNTRVIHK
jgi:uncharacterized RDD family membrane protein YckC